MAMAEWLPSCMGEGEGQLGEAEEAILEEWNVTLKGDHLWTNMFVGEVFPSTMTPSSWSVWEELLSNLFVGDVPSFGSIAGRPYLNYSLTYSFLLKLLRDHDRVMARIKDAIGAPPVGVDIPSFPVSWGTVLFRVVPQEFRKELKKAKLKKNAPAYLSMVRDRCQELRRAICEAQGDELVSLWTDELKPLWNEIHCLQDKMNEDLDGLTGKLKTELTQLLGEEEANAFVATITGAGEMASLGPLVGLSKVRNGEMAREAYVQRYGHRGPHENELSEPRPYEDPDWVDKQLAASVQSPVDVTSLLRKRSAEFASKRQVMADRLPAKRAEEIAAKIDELVETNSAREATRSELTRVVGVVRALFQRAGELIGAGEGVFFLTIDEVIDVLEGGLGGESSPVARIPERRELHERYAALPPLPAWIRGWFDPFEWAADPNRRSDVFAPGADLPDTTGADTAIRGHPGSAGRVEGLVRRIDSPEEGGQLEAGEILVTSRTNVGWTPLFPRAAAVVTDIGTSLSHAAIVARELGIPAVVGCGNATMRLKSGDRVRVDGGKGVVEILEGGREQE